MTKKTTLLPLAALCIALSGCHGAKIPEPPVAKPAEPVEASLPAYVLPNTEVRDITSGPLGRTYQLFVSLPPSYEERVTHRFPVLFVTDASYAFPLVRNIGLMVGDRGKGLEEFVLIGLSYAKGETGAVQPAARLHADTEQRGHSLRHA